LRLPGPPSFGGLRICGHQLARFAGDREGVDRLPILKLSPGRRRGRGFCLCGALAPKYNWGREVADALLRNASHQQRRPSRKSPPPPNSSRDLICLGPAQRLGAFVSAKNFQQNIYADRDQDGANRDKCFSGHCLTPPREDRRQVRSLPEHDPPPAGRRLLGQMLLPRLMRRKRLDGSPSGLDHPAIGHKEQAPALEGHGAK
jgi:hypothetical protein